MYWVIFYIKPNQIIAQHIYNTLTVSCKKSKTVSFVSSIMENTNASSLRSKFPVKLICWIAVGWASRACFLLKSITFLETRII